MKYFGSHIPEYIRLTQPKEKRQRVTEIDKKVLRDVMERSKKCR